jgi:N-acetylneuraminic acid mutarotase
MVVWSGEDTNNNALFDGAAYDPAQGTWQPLSTTGEPTARATFGVAVWTGSEMLVWGGATGGNTPALLGDGGRYAPASGTWGTIAAAGAPSARTFHTAVWTGSNMIIWGGNASAGGFSAPAWLDTGGNYDPVQDSWTPTPLSGAPIPRDSHSAVWTGGEMIIWGGSVASSGSNPGGVTRTGAKLNPATGTWSPTTKNNAPAARMGHTAVWTGTEMLVWGGVNANAQYLGDGGRYNPASDSWTPISMNGAPAARGNHYAVWSGAEMVIWGGSTDPTLPPVNTGARYNPATDTWTALPTTGAPSGRYTGPYVWAGTEMIIWGGSNGTEFLSDGASIE